MKNKILITVLVVLATIGLVKLKTYWDLRKAVIIAPVLTETEKSKDVIDVRARTVTRVTRDGDNQVSTVIRGVRDVAITELKDGTIKTVTINKGFTFEPGLTLGTDSEDSLIGLDAQFFYWSEFGLVKGLMVPTSNISLKKIRFYLAISYDLGRIKLHNTSAILGIDTKKRILLGARIRF